MGLLALYTYVCNVFTVDVRVWWVREERLRAQRVCSHCRRRYVRAFSYRVRNGFASTGIRPHACVVLSLGAKFRVQLVRSSRAALPAGGSVETVFPVTLLVRSIGLHARGSRSFIAASCPS